MEQALKDWVLLFFGFDWLNVILTVAGLLILGLLIFWQMRQGDGFDFRAMLASRATVAGEEKWSVEPGRVFQTGAFVVTTWGYFWLSTHDKLTIEAMVIYAGLWAGSRAINQIVASKFPVAPGTQFVEQPPQPTQGAAP